MADHVDEITLPEGILRVEVDGAGHITAYLNGAEITKDRAEKLVERARRRMGEQQ